jgi:hypothetical protein
LCSEKNRLDIAGFADNGTAERQGVFITDVFIEPRLTSGRNQDESGRENRSFQKSGLLVNYRKLQMNRAKTSFLQLREDAFESLGED